MKKAYLNCTVIDGKGNVIEDAAVLTADNLITAVGKKEDVKIPKDARVMDVTGKTLMPGMMDAHTHHTISSSGNLIESSLNTYGALCSLQTYVNLLETLKAGFTTVRDVGAMEYCDVAAKTMIESGKLIGPRVIACGKELCQTGGHGEVCERFPWVTTKYSAVEVCDGVAECRRAVRKQVWMGVDTVKIFASSGIYDPYTGHTRNEFAKDELEAIIEEAKAAGKKIAVHCHSASNAKICIQAGVSSIEHGMYLDEETLDMMVEYGTVWVPTATVYFNIAGGENQGVNASSVENAQKGLAIQEAMFRKALRKGVKIGLGTDAGTVLTPHGSNARELEIFNKWGMNTMECIKAATMINAELFGVDKITGSIEAGKEADMLIIDGNPLQDIRILQEQDKILQVIKGGNEIKNIM